MLCGNTRDNLLIARAAHATPQLFDPLDVVSCGECASAWFPEARVANVDYLSTEDTTGDPWFEYFIDHYLELVNGLDWKVPLLEQLPFDRFGRVLEVGCGVGVTLDFCRVVWGADVVGLEPSAYGRWGRRLLDLDVRPSYMADLLAGADERFDLIYSTEVIEHVADPVQFLREARSLLTDDGVLMLTTPRAESLTPDTPLGPLYGALSAGAHYFLPSAGQLESIARRAGFTWCSITPAGVSHVAVLAGRPVDISSWEGRADRIADYYAVRARTPSPERPRCQLGASINHYVTASQQSRTIDPRHWVEIRRGVIEHFGVDLDDPRPHLAEIEQTTSLFEMGAVLPFNIAAALYWHARELRASGRSPGHYGALAMLLTSHGLSVDYRQLWTMRPLFELLGDPGAPVGNDELSSALLDRAHKIAAGVPELADEVPPQVVVPGSAPPRRPWVPAPARRSVRFVLRHQRALAARLRL